MRYDYDVILLPLRVPLERKKIKVLLVRDGNEAGPNTREPLKTKTKITFHVDPLGLLSSRPLINIKHVKAEDTG